MGKIVKAVGIAALIIVTGGAAAYAAVSAGAFGAATAIITLTNALAINTVLGGIVKQFAPRSRTAGNPAVSVEYEGTVEPRRIIYGRMRVSGMHTIEPLTSGASNKYLHEVLTLAGHQCNAITSVYLSNEEITSANIGAVTGSSTNDGAVTTGSFANVFWCRRYLGTATQAADYTLRTDLPTAWTTAHQGKGVTYLANRYAYDVEKYRAGKPQVEALVEGKLCYDPRLDSTNGGSGTQRYTDPTTWAWTQNPALCAADYLIDASLGPGVPAATRINWPSVITAANICDELVNLPGATTQKRYTCNVVLEATTDYADNIAILARAMLGHVYRSGGTWYIFAGAWTASAFTLTADDFMGRFEMATRIPARERYNAVRSLILDAAQNYRQVEAPAALNATYETDDGGVRRFTEVALPTCTNAYEAQRACILLNRQGRNRETVTADFGFNAYKIKPFETGTVTLPEVGWTNQTVRCVAWTFSANGAIRLVLKEAYSTDWTDPATTDYGSPATVADVAINKFNPSAPNNVTATPVVDGILFAWDLPDIVIPGTTYSIYEHTAATPFSSAVAVAGATGLTGTSKTVPKADTTTRYYWVVPRGPSGGVGTESPSGSGVAGKALSITTGFRATATPGSRTKTGSTASLTTLSVTVAPVNGTAPYTYAWTTVSGGTIAITSSTSATTTFSATSLADPETRTGVKRCTITDNTAATATVDVNLQFTRDSSLYL